MADKEKNAGQEAAVKKAKKAANADSTKSGKGKKDGKEKKGFFSQNRRLVQRPEKRIQKGCLAGPQESL